jgi:hypothetical protein
MEGTGQHATSITMTFGPKPTTIRMGYLQKPL